LNVAKRPAVAQARRPNDSKGTEKKVSDPPVLYFQVRAVGRKPVVETTVGHQLPRIKSDAECMEAPTDRAPPKATETL
jgi:hypothetical protein